MTQWQDCTFEEAVATGLEKCQCRTSSLGTYWSFDCFKPWTFSVVFEAKWRRPVTSAAPDPGDGWRYLQRDELTEELDECRIPTASNPELREWRITQLKPGSPLNPDWAYRRRVEAQKVEGDDWTTFGSTSISAEGCVTLDDAFTIAHAGTGWFSPLFKFLAPEIQDGVRVLIRRWQSHQKPKLPTVEAPEGGHWEIRGNKICLIVGELAPLFPPETKLIRDCMAALVAAWDELNGGNNA